MLLVARALPTGSYATHSSQKDPSSVVFSVFSSFDRLSEALLFVNVGRKEVRSNESLRRAQRRDAIPYPRGLPRNEARAIQKN